MAQPPRLPEFDKEKFKDEPLFAAFWELIQPHLKLNARVLDHGASVADNLAAAWVEYEVTGSQSFPIRLSPPLAPGLTPYGVLCVGAWDPANPGATILSGTAVQPDWVAAEDGGITIRRLTGDMEGIPVRLRFLVLAR